MKIIAAIPGLFLLASLPVLSACHNLLPDQWEKGGSGDGGLGTDMSQCETQASLAMGVIPGGARPADSTRGAKELAADQKRISDTCLRNRGWHKVTQ